MKYCSECGEKVTRRVPEGDTRPRHICDECGMVHYRNPKIVAGCIPVWERKILLCRRAINPRHGLWTLPAGFMENRETVAEAAARETMEEACAEIVNSELYAVYNIPRISQVYVMFRAELLDVNSFGPGEESLEVELFTEADIPWEQIAFPVVKETLLRFLDDRKRGVYPVRVDDIR
ncbi:MAG: NUDIX hydrolase [Pseudomonadota bacterium]|nr:NUDIX hydrolase [Pseudomonadota bacterium]